MFRDCWLLITFLVCFIGLVIALAFIIPIEWVAMPAFVVAIYSVLLIQRLIKWPKDIAVELFYAKAKIKELEEDNQSKSKLINFIFDSDMIMSDLFKLRKVWYDMRESISDGIDGLLLFAS